MIRTKGALKKGGLASAFWLAGVAISLWLDWRYVAIGCAYVAGAICWATYLDLVEARAIDKFMASKKEGDEGVDE